MDRIVKKSESCDGVKIGDCHVQRLLFADDFVLLDRRDIETWLEIQPLILRTETLSIPENDVRTSVSYPMVFGNFAIYHFQKNKPPLVYNEIMY